MEVYDRKAKFTELKKYCHLAKENDFIEVTEWKNGEGFDVHMSSDGNKTFSLSWGEFEALQSCVTYKG